MKMAKMIHQLTGRSPPVRDSLGTDRPPDSGPRPGLFCVGVVDHVNDRQAEHHDECCVHIREFHDCRFARIDSNI